MSHLDAALAAAAAVIAAATSPAVSADPGLLPTPGEAAACEQAWSPPMDPRANMRYGLGAVAYYAWVRGQCAGPGARFPNGAAVAGSGLQPDVPAWQKLPAAGPAPSPNATGVLG